MSLAVKYRPKTWEDVTEQSVVVDMLKAMCESDNLENRNFLLTGSAGCGKTTLCRIMANVLNKGEGDPIEIDAASNSGIDSIREIVKQARQYPIVGKYKIFIIDEAHALSSAAWQALLLPIESGVANSIFMFATTNPEKIPATIISRVQSFQLAKISLEGIIKRLIHVIELEQKGGRNITYEYPAVSYIAKLAQGGMRDALTLLDKALAYSPDITSDNISKALNIPEYDDYFALLNAYVSKNNSEISNIVDRIYNSGVNFNKWFESWHSFVVNIVKYIFLKDINRTMIPIQYEDKISNYSEKHAQVCLKLANKLIKLNYELKTTQYLQEVALTYLCSSK